MANFWRETVRACNQIKFVMVLHRFRVQFFLNDRIDDAITFHLLRNSRMDVCRHFYFNGLKCIFSVSFISKFGSQRAFVRIIYV